MRGPSQASVFTAIGMSANVSTTLIGQVLTQVMGIFGGTLNMFTNTVGGLTAGLNGGVLGGMVPTYNAYNGF